MLDVATIRTAQAADLDQIRALARRALIHDDDAADVVDVLWNAPTSRPELRVIAESAGRIVGVALGSLRSATFRDGHLDLFAIEPDRHGVGIGRQLLGEVEGRLRDARVECLLLGGNTPYFGWPGIDIRYTAALCLARSMGYRRTRLAYNMTVDLHEIRLATAEDEERLAAEGIAVRRLRSAEIGEFDAWVRRFGGTWHIETARAAISDPTRVHVALRGDTYAGFACHGVNRRAWFGPMGTDSSERGRGIGTVLLRRCLADMRTDGLAIADIGWVDPYEFYSRTVGASLAKVYWIFEKAI
ncbi:MAG TPA: GNAT family N-acetyltransferase [Micromonosporaceae bacterium]|jgi:predicted N-acetyltransferase YhbS